jgi:hypothetical protein
LTKNAPGFTAAKNLASNVPVVAGASGVAFTTKSASPVSFGSSSGRPT